MFSNLKRAVSLALLAGAANLAFAAPAPVSDLNSTPSQGSETEVQRLERLLQNRAHIQLQMQQQIDTMSVELNELRGKVERNSYEMKQMLDRQRELFIELDRVRNQAVSPNVNVEPAESPDVSDTGGVYVADANEEAAYKNAVYVVKVEKDFPKAIAAFTKFQKDFPNSPYMANTHYWIGQLHYALKQDVDSTKSFASVVAYKDSNKRADSLVKLGDIAKRNGKAEVAKKYYQQAIDEYPGSASAEMAQSKLK